MRKLPDPCQLQLSGPIRACVILGCLQTLFRQTVCVAATMPEVNGRLLDVSYINLRLSFPETFVVTCFHDAGRIKCSDSVQTWVSASMARLQGSHDQHDCRYQAAYNHYEIAVTLLICSLESEQESSLRWLQQQLLCKTRLDQAESCCCVVWSQRSSGTVTGIDIEF